MPEEHKRSFNWEKGCYAWLVALGMAFFFSWLEGCFELVSGVMFGFFIIWQVVRGLVIKRYFWHIAEEKVSFWSLAVAVAMAWLLYGVANK